jgi:internalin A
MPTPPPMTPEAQAAYEEAQKRIARCREEKKTELDLFSLGLTALPPELFQLTALTQLNLHNNRLTGLPPELGQLKALSVLCLGRNEFTALPPELFQLTALRRLELYNNQLTTLPRLDLGNNQLAVLDLGNNQLTALPPELDQLRALEQLYLDNNQLTALPPELGQLRALEHLYLHDNSGLDLPAEVLGPTWREVIDNKATAAAPRGILDYYFRINDSGEATALNEFKLILVGRGAVGKTTLVEKLVNDHFVKFEKTPGIKITQWPMKSGRERARAHVWDFGGQEIMHGTHRFFMTERALYLVLITGREGTEDQDAEYWLSLIRSFAGDVPVLVLLHKWSEQKFELSRELLREKYGKNITFLETDSGEKKKQEKNIAKLRGLIAQSAAKLPGLKVKWPKAWRSVKDELPAAKQNWLTFVDFQKFCTAHQVTKTEEQETLAARLHDLGLMLAYRQEESLRGFGVLNSTWVTDGIYKMLNSETLQDRRGKFKLADFADVLPKKEYPARLHPYLLALMQKFRLCFPLDDSGHEYLIPELLSKREPELDGEFPPETSLCFTYQYDTILPEGLLPRFIVETHVQRETKHAWKTGVVLERANCRALVRGDIQARKITIRVTGKGNGRRELLGIVREHFERIHRDFTKLPVTEMVPVPGHPDVMLDYEELLGFERDEVEELPKRVAGKTVRLKIKDLLDGVDVEGSARRENLLIDLRGGSRRNIQDGRVHSADMSVFISYAHKDERFLEQLRIALVPYERKGELRVWSDPLIEAGQEWREEIFTNLDRADIFILLLSPQSVASEFVNDKELPRAMELRKKGVFEIMPVVIKPCGWKKLELAELQVVLPDGKSISQAKNRDAAWQDVTEQLNKVMARVKKKR